MEKINYLRNSKLIKLLRTSDKKEQKRFGEYISSSFFNKNENVVFLWKLIKTCLPDFEQTPTEKELLDILYAGKHQAPEKWGAKEDTQLRVLMNRLTGLFCDFLLYQRKETEEVRNQRLLADEFMERKLYKMIPPVLKTANKILTKRPYRDCEYYYDEYLIREAEFYNNIINRNRAIDSNSNRVIESFSNYTLSNLMLYYASYANSLQLVNISDDFLSIDNLIKHIESNQKTNSEIVIIYYHVYMMILMNEKTDKHYNQLKSILVSFGQYLSIGEMNFIYSFVINYCVRKMAKGEEEFRSELYSVYKHTIPLGVWDTARAFSPHHYIGHFRNMLHLQKYEEAIEFQEEYQSKLQTKYIPDIPNLGYAFYYFHLGEYDTSQEYLNQVVDREDFIYKFYCKCLLIKIYYEKKEWSVIESALEALRFYLLPKRSKEISEQIRGRQKLFLNICKKILRQRNNAEYNQASLNILEKIKKEIKEAKSLSERAWLLEKTEELIAETTSNKK